MRTSLHFAFSSGILSLSSDARSMAEMSVQDERVGGRGRREDGPQRPPSVPSQTNAYTPTSPLVSRSDAPDRQHARKYSL